MKTSETLALGAVGVGLTLILWELWRRSQAAPALTNTDIGPPISPTYTGMPADGSTPLIFLSAANPPSPIVDPRL